MTTRLAFRGHPALTKAAFLAETEAHREADRLRQGSYGSPFASLREFQGCAIGCAIRSIMQRAGFECIRTSDHECYAELVLGGATDLAYLEDAIFERLGAPAALAWPERFVAAIPDGADLSQVGREFLAALLRELRGCVEGEEGREVIERFIVACEASAPQRRGLGKLRRLLLEHGDSCEALRPHGDVLWQVLYNTVRYLEGSDPWIGNIVSLVAHDDLILIDSRWLADRLVGFLEAASVPDAMREAPVPALPVAFA